MKHPLGILLIRFHLSLLAAVSLNACDSSNNDNRVKEPVWQRGVYPPSSQFQHYCAEPRTGINPRTGEAYRDRQGTAMHEKMWQRSLTEELYLWYDQVADIDPTPYTIPGYFAQLTVPDDRFQFSTPADEYFQSNQLGTNLDYGVVWSINPHSPTPTIRVMRVESSSAAADSVQRGDYVEAVDGIPLDQVTSDDIPLINQALNPTEAGETHVFTVRGPADDTTRDVVLSASEVIYASVPLTQTFNTSVGTTGYMLFTDHNAVAERELIESVESLFDAGISDLILDLRYNPGGYLAIASQLAYMIAGPGYTQGQVFEVFEFNDQYGSINPVTGETIEPYLFYDQSQGYSNVPPGTDLPTLNLDRLVVLTGPQTCSASESIINSLIGVNLPVIQIGSATCGKPYGSYPIENCGRVYSTIMFKGANAKGFGDFANGFSPVTDPTLVGAAMLPGCPAEDDLDHALGSPNEGMLATALNYLTEGVCPDTTANAAALIAPDRADQTKYLFQPEQWQLDLRQIRRPPEKIPN